MTKTISVMLLAAGAAWANPQSSAPPAPASAAQARKKPVKATPPLTIPSRAVKQADGSYRFVDDKRQPWIYRQTPFGVSRTREADLVHAAGAAQPTVTVQTPFGASRSTPAAPTAPASAAAPAMDDSAHVTAVADGDSIRFERPTPFGKSTWRKSKSDLTPDEQKIWDREQAKRNQ